MQNLARQVKVRVPATTANLGAGFDIFGLALQLYNTFTLTLTSEADWRVSLPPGIDLPTDDRNLALQAARRVFNQAGLTPPGLHLQQDIAIPLARGLGSSSAAIVGGLVAANALSDARFSQDALLTMAIDIEGHPDNVTPALLGGMTLSYTVDTHHHYQRLPFPERLLAVVAIPEFELSTAAARAVLPRQISRADAIFNSSRTALLVHALQHEQLELLAAAMDDRLHQPYRAALVPGMSDAMQAAYQAQALGVALSGAGPTLLALSIDHSEAIAAALQAAFKRHQIACQTRVLKADLDGAVVLTPTA